VKPPTVVSPFPLPPLPAELFRACFEAPPLELDPDIEVCEEAADSAAPAAQVHELE
jgi:hypothetical protein